MEKKRDGERKIKGMETEKEEGWEITGWKITGWKITGWRVENRGMGIKRDRDGK